MAEHDQTPVALTIAGSDSSGGAGIQADLKTFTVLGVYGASVLTALTAQNTRGVAAILPVPPEFVTQQIDAVAGDLRIAAVKTGMLNDRATVLAVVEGVRRHRLGPLVVDPVMVATSGDMLLQPDAIEAVRGELLPLADIVTPNLAEAARLLDRSPAEDEAGMLAQAQALLALGPKAVLLKGGHGEGIDAVDILVARGRAPVRLALPRIERATRTALDARYRLPSPPAWPGELLGCRRCRKAFRSRGPSGRPRAENRGGSGPVDHLHTLRGSPQTLSFGASASAPVAPLHRLLNMVWTTCGQHGLL